MRKLPFIPLFILFIFAQISCSTVYRGEQIIYKDYRIVGSQPKDSSMLLLLKPYSDSVIKSMSALVGVFEKTLEKKPPGGSLGHFMADAYLMMAAKKFNTKIDVAIMNYGGIRLVQVAAGNISTGKIFELMPFDNVLVLQKMKGSVLQQFLDHVAKLGGWPFAGLTMQVKNKKAINVMIGGKPLDPNAMYTTVNSDYVANGGEDAEMLRNIPFENINYLARTALFEYINYFTLQGKPVPANEVNSVTYVD